MEKEKTKKFEENLEELESIIKELETGDVDLDDAINKYTKAMKITKECSDKLSSVEKQVNKILTESGKLEEFNIE